MSGINEYLGSITNEVYDGISKLDKMANEADRIFTDNGPDSEDGMIRQERLSKLLLKAYAESNDFLKELQNTFNAEKKGLDGTAIDLRNMEYYILYSNRAIMRINTILTVFTSAQITGQYKARQENLKEA